MSSSFWQPIIDIEGCARVLKIISGPGDGWLICPVQWRLLEAPAQNAREKCTQSLQLDCFLALHTLTYVILYQQTLPIRGCSLVPRRGGGGEERALSLPPPPCLGADLSRKLQEFSHYFQGLPWNCVLYNKEISHSVTFFANGYTLWQLASLGSSVYFQEKLWNYCFSISTLHNSQLYIIQFSIRLLKISLYISKCTRAF